MMLTGMDLAEVIDAAVAEYYLPAIDGESFNDDTLEGEDGAKRYVLLERGHYGQTWVSFHDSPEDASDYSLNQECGEDWEPTVLIDRETRKHLLPRAIVWEARD